MKRQTPPLQRTTKIRVDQLSQRIAGGFSGLKFSSPDALGGVPSANGAAAASSLNGALDAPRPKGGMVLIGTTVPPGAAGADGVAADAFATGCNGRTLAATPGWVGRITGCRGGGAVGSIRRAPESAFLVLLALGAIGCGFRAGGSTMQEKSGGVEPDFGGSGSGVNGTAVADDTSRLTTEGGTGGQLPPAGASGSRLVGAPFSGCGGV